MGCGASRSDGNGLALPAKLRPIFAHRLEEIKMRGHGHNKPLKINSINSTPSKKELLVHEGDEDIDNDVASTSSKSVSTNKSVSQKLDEGNKVNNHNNDDHEKKKKKRDEAHHDLKDDSLISKNGENEVIVEDAMKVKKDRVIEDRTKMDTDNPDEDDDRMIGHRYRDDHDGGFPGSPSFRVYFKDDGRNKHIINHDHDDAIAQKKDVLKDKIPSDDLVSSKECSSSDETKKIVKKGKKKSSFRRVLPKGGQAAVKNLFSASSCYSTPPPSAAHNHHQAPHLLTGKTTV